MVGADRLHSGVRTLAFGPESRFEKFLGYTVAAFEVSGYSARDDDIYVAYSAPGRQVARFSLRDDRSMFLCVIAEATAGALPTHDGADQRQYLRARLAGLGWECQQILAGLERCHEIYVDRVSQIRMDRWTKNRVALVGDAAFAPSLLAGQGCALAIIGAYVLAGELARAEQPQEAFARYEALLRPFLLRKQDGAKGFASSFAPRTRFGIFLRNQITRLLAAPRLAKLAFSRSVLDRIQLPNYASGP